MNLGLLTAIWGRPRLTELVLEYYKFMRNIDCTIAVCDPSEIDLYRNSQKQPWWGFIDYPNEPLSNKWNGGMSCMDLDDPLDGVMIVGSDDLVTPQYIETVKYLLDKGADYIFLPSLYFYNLQDGRMHWCMAERLGLGRVLSRRLLDMLDWRPWPDGLNRGLDGAMWEKIKELKEVKIVKLDIKACKELGIAAMDIKGAQNNIWDYETATGSLIGKPIRNPETVLREHFPSVADELLNWNKEYAGS